MLGVEDLLSRTAMCCNPVPGQEIIGYITRGRGVTIHRRSCPNVQSMINKDPNRLVEVNWGHAVERTHPVRINRSRPTIDPDCCATLLRWSRMSGSTCAMPSA